MFDIAARRLSTHTRFVRIQRVSVAFVVIAFVACASLCGRVATAHTTADFLPLQFEGYADPFGHDETETYTGVWGTEFGDEAFAYLGSLSSGVAIVDVSNPKDPVTVSVFGNDLKAGISDIRTAGTVGYFSTTSLGTLIVDLSMPTAPELLGSVSSFDKGHDSVSNAWVHQDYLFQVSGEESDIAVFDISNPILPQFAHRIETNDSVGVFDLSIVDDRLYAAGLGGNEGEGATYIYDVGNLGSNSPSLIAQITTGSNTASVWPNSDHTKIMVTEREAGGAATAWDISDPAVAFQIDSANASDLDVNAFSAGELFVLDNVAYTAWHQAGVQAIDLDLLEQSEIVARIGAFGTSQASPLEGFVGNTGVYPLGHDRILLSDSRWGLYVVNATKVVTVAPDLELVCSDVANGLLTANDLANTLGSLGLVPGDADRNGVVQFADFLVLTQNFGQAAVGFGGGDFDCSGEVEFGDFLALAQNFGATPAATVSVPEPACPIRAIVVAALSGTLFRSSRDGRRRTTYF